MGILDFISTMGQQQNAANPNALSRIGSAVGSVVNNSGLQRLGQMDSQRRNDEHMMKVFAANPQFAERMYGTQQNQQLIDAKRQESLKPRLEQVGSALLRILPDGSFEQVYKDNSGGTSSLQELAALEGMTQEQKDNFWRIKRAEKIIDTGGKYERVNPDGTTTTLADKTYAPGQSPEDKAKIAAQTTQAELDTKAKTDAAIMLPEVEAAAANDIKNIDELLKHPGMSSAVGAKGMASLFGLRDEPVEGTDAANFKTRLSQLKGGTFLQAYKGLKGGGAITDLEGGKAEQAIARLDTAQSEDEFITALNDYKDVVKKGIERMRQKAGGAASTQSATPNADSKREKALQILKSRGVL